MSRLKELRKEKGYTQVKMQLLTGIDQSDYSKIENGKRYYTFEQCRKIALALETSMDYLAKLTPSERESLNFVTLRCGILTVTLRARFRCLSRSKEAPVEVTSSKVILSGRMERLAQRNKIKLRITPSFLNPSDKPVTLSPTVTSVYPQIQNCMLKNNQFFQKIYLRMSLKMI
mgnify:CR=1 FL=1